MILPALSAGLTPDSPATTLGSPLVNAGMRGYVLCTRWLESPAGVICLTLRIANGIEHDHPQSGRFHARSQSPSSVAYRLRKLATPIALGPRRLP
jgi:hypothetical protein